MRSQAEILQNCRDLQPHQQTYQQQFDAFKAKQLALDITRGKPSPEQLDLSNALLTLPGTDFNSNHTDTRNYGGIDGLPQMKALFGEILNIDPQNVIVGGNSSLNMMYDTLARGCQFGVPGGRPWNENTSRKFLCPSPGYDRHFKVTEHLGFELISVNLTDQGLDMDQIEALVAEDHDIKGIWCVPKYSNPTGTCYEADTVRRLAQMDAASDFRILWDNAYAEHHLSDHRPGLENIMTHCVEAGNPDRVIQFASTSKISHPGSGVAALAASDANIADIRTHLSVQTIGPDKVNQLRHLALFADINALRIHMQQHASLVKPKFDAVDAILERDLGPLGIAHWTKPQGGYFISLDIPQGLAGKVIGMAAEAGVKLTGAGAPFPYGKDPRDQNIRIAPTFPSLEEVVLATDVLTTCICLAASQLAVD